MILSQGEHGQRKKEVDQRGYGSRGEVSVLYSCSVVFYNLPLTLALQQATTMPGRVGQSSRTPGRDNMGQEEVIHSLRMWTIASPPVLDVSVK